MTGKKKTHDVMNIRKKKGGEGLSLFSDHRVAQWEGAKSMGSASPDVCLKMGSRRPNLSFPPQHLSAKRGLGGAKNQSYGRTTRGWGATKSKRGTPRNGKRIKSGSRLKDADAGEVSMEGGCVCACIWTIYWRETLIQESGAFTINR